MWLVINNADNSVAAGPVDPKPTPGIGQHVVEQCVGTTWSPTAGGFVDTAAKLSRDNFFVLFTGSEQLAIVNSTNPQVRLALAAAQFADVIDFSNSAVTGAIDGMVALGLLTAARAVRIKAGLPPLPS